jgi:CheY-like chemotaxis protein
METYCPSCGMSVVAVAEGEAGAQVWRCCRCSLLLKDESSDSNAAQPLGRIALTRVPAAEVLSRRAAAVSPPQQARRRLIPPEPEGIDLPQAPQEEFIIESLSESAGGAPPAKTAASAPAEGEFTTPARVAFERVMVAEDSALLREVIKDALAEAGISHEVQTCGNGEEFLEAMADGIWRERLPNLAILDVGMPVLNGYYTAIALRAIERGLQVSPTPIVYFTAHACDDTFKKVLEYTQPARYLNKGADAAPMRIAERLVLVLASLRR